MNKHSYVAIMAGGIGSRFWPKSRTSYPKQFLDILHTGKSLLQSTYDRFSGFFPTENIYIVTSEDYISIVQDQLPKLPQTNILAEPCRRNTAPCIAYIAFRLQQQDPEARLLVAPADHLIRDTLEFEVIVRQAFDFVGRHNAFVTLGIKPDQPNTGYGYIRYNKSTGEGNVYPVVQFTEKPKAELARHFLQSGDYLWNAGIFIWKTSDLLKSFEQYLPDMYRLFAGKQSDFGTTRELAAITSIYSQCESVSIDYGIMEKASAVWVIPADFGWSDLGTWNSAYESLGKDQARNALAGKNIMTVNTTGCMVHAKDCKLVLVEGVDNLIVIDTDDVLLICRKENEQEIKQYVAEIARQKGTDYL